jgi:hypothetical protein
MIYAPAMWSGGFPKEEPPLYSTMTWASTLGWYLTVPHMGGLRCCLTTSSAALGLIQPSTLAGFDGLIAARINAFFLHVALASFGDASSGSALCFGRPPLSRVRRRFSGSLNALTRRDVLTP